LKTGARMRPTITAVFAAFAAGAATAQQVAVPERGEALVATSRAFVFYSDALTNLHDFLIWNTFSRQPVEPAPECLAGLPAEQRTAFEDARKHYDVFRTPDGNRLLLALRYRLAGFGDSGLADAAAVEAALAALRPAAPAYEKCWWPSHDARNRRWIATLEPLLAAHEEALSARLTELYGEALQRPLPVDVVGYASFGGGNTVVNPHQILISSAAPANASYSGLELLFHEASHTVFGPRTPGPLWNELEAAVKADGAPLPSEFDHAMLFYTTGSAVKARLAEREIAYELYMYREGLFERAWPGYRGPLERLWQPYLDGRVARAEALKQLVAAHKLPDRGDAFVAASRTFVFYSDRATNLNDFLVSNARSSEPLEPKSECLAGLPAEQRTAFEHARDYYKQAFAGSAGDLVLLSMRWRLAKLGEVSLADPAQIAAAVAELAPAMPAYETCWWREHDERNRRWIASLMPRLDANEEALRARLTELYGLQLARSLPVDVVGYTFVDGGGAVLNPHQLLISSARPWNAGDAALESLFRVASQTIFSVRAPGPLWRELQNASTSAAKPLPQEFSQLLPFFATGKAVQARLAAQGVRDYVPYVYREGVLERASPTYRDVLERVWQPYIDGRLPLAEAAKQTVEALPAAAR
jgi:hypothetical protein